MSNWIELIVNDIECPYCFGINSEYCEFNTESGDRGGVIRKGQLVRCSDCDKEFDAEVEFQVSHLRSHKLKSDKKKK